VRPAIYVAAIIALAACAPQTARMLLACAASIILESLPYLAASTLLGPLAGRHARALAAYAGCGCGIGPSARSLPAAIATAALFGAPAALARLAAATLVARARPGKAHAAHPSLLDELRRLAPAALLGALAMLVAPALGLTHRPAVLAFGLGVILGAVASPCALGGVALAAALRASAPWAAYGVLCSAGTFDLYAWRRAHAHPALRDPLAYAAIAAACALVAARHGGALVHPHLALPLAATAVLCTWSAWCARASGQRACRPLVAALLLAIVVGAPVPAYLATETTLADGFAGERIAFTGVAVHERARSALVRYAITCCRADAAPIAIALDRNLANVSGRWMHANGTLQTTRDGTLQLHVQQLTPITPPSDPFVYR
jgi:hypothetical protein